MKFTRCVPWALATILLIPGSPSLAGEIEFRFTFPAPELSTDGGYTRVAMGDLPLSEITGEPLLPLRPVRILIPRDAEFEECSVIPGREIALPGSYVIAPAQKPRPLSNPGVYSPTPPDPAIYDSDVPYPGARKTDVAIQRKGPFVLLILNLQPLSYRPAGGKISYFESLAVRVVLTTRRMDTAVVRRGTALQRRSVLNKVENPGVMDTYESEPRRGEEGPLDTHPHVIITTDALAAAAGAYTFQDLRDHRISRGMSSVIVTVDGDYNGDGTPDGGIYANFDGTKPSGGSDNQTRLRNFIDWAHANWDTEYVLLGGAAGIVPARLLYAYAGGYTDNIPADLYYGNLDGTFDNDADGVYGETNDGLGGGDIDLYSEVYIGRACVENDTDVSNFVRKTLAYESSGGDYLTQVRMVGEHLGFGGVAEYAKASMEEIRLGSCEHGYCTEGFSASDFFQTSTLYDADGTWAKSQLVTIINSGVHVLNHLGHASYTYDMKLYTSDLSSLTNTDYFFLYSQGCMPGGFDTANCFAEVVTTMDHGAFAAVLNARYGWGEFNSTAGPSQYYDREFWDALFGEGIRALGAMNADSKEDNDLRINDDCMRWCFYELNLFGDPATEVQNISSKGMVSFDADAYPIPGTATVTVMDLDLDTDTGSPDTVTVEVRSDTEQSPESLLLTETGGSTKTFRASLPLATGSPTGGDGILQVADGDTVTVVYHDADDGTGNPADVQDTATADGSPPTISNIQFTPSVTSCTITWATNEASNSLVRHGEGTPPATETTDSVLTTSHSVRIRSLDPLTTYYFEVASADSVGNTATDNNGGSYYQFTTLERGAILFVDDDEGDPYESYFTSALDANSYAYDEWDVDQDDSAPTFGDLDDYQVVIWNCGYDYSSSESGLTEEDESAISQYLDSGGSVFLCGQDIIYNGVSAAFRTNYLHLAGYDSDDTTTQANGIEGDRVSDGMSLALSYPFTNWSDSLAPDASSCGAFLTDGSTTHPYCASRYPADGVSGPFKIVFFAFPFEAVSSSDPDPDNASSVMDRVLQFLGPVDIDESSPAYGLNDRAVVFTINGSGFKAGAVVTIGGLSLAVSSVSSTEISATLPAGLAPGGHDLAVRNPDSLGAAVPDAYTALDPAEDGDGDGLDNEAEVAVYGTNPFAADTDGDGLNDGDEVTIYGTNPLSTDSDDDCLTDYEEVVTYGSNPLSANGDGDDWCDILEICGGSDPNVYGWTAASMNITVSFQPEDSVRPDGCAPSTDAGYTVGLGYGWL